MILMFTLVFPFLNAIRTEWVLTLFAFLRLVDYALADTTLEELVNIMRILFSQKLPHIKDIVVEVHHL